MLTSAVYPAYDLAWQMEELLMETPDLDKLAGCVALLRVSVRGFGADHGWGLFMVQCRVCGIAKGECALAWGLFI
jgi:hypothetical protein